MRAGRWIGHARLLAEVPSTSIEYCEVYKIPSRVGTDESRNGTERNGTNRGARQIKNRLKQVVQYFQLSHNN